MQLLNVGLTPTRTPLTNFNRNMFSINVSLKSAVRFGAFEYFKKNMVDDKV